MKPRYFLPFLPVFIVLAVLSGCRAEAPHPAPHPAVAPSPYVGAQDRAIKALAPEDIARYLSGEGMGFAMAAELNAYPGPRHVLDLADTLALTPAQRQATQALFDAMKADATRLGAEIVAAERALDGLFAEGHATPEAVRDRTAEIAEMTGRLRYAHLQAHLQMKDLLTPAQRTQYDALRGYASHDPSAHDPSAHNPSAHNPAAQ